MKVTESEVSSFSGRVTRSAKSASEDVFMDLEKFNTNLSLRNGNVIVVNHAGTLRH